jgi:hypothetical protein
MRWHGFREHLGETHVEWGRREPEPEPKPEQLDTAPVDWHVVIRAAVDVALAEGRRFNREVLAGGPTTLSAPCGRRRSSSPTSRRPLAEVRLAFATDRTQALDLPNPLPKRAGLN